MVKSVSMVTKKSEAVTLCDDLHAIAARLAGVEEVLREMGEKPAGRGNTLHLLAGVVATANDQICRAADRVSDLHTVESAQ